MTSNRRPKHQAVMENTRQKATWIALESHSDVNRPSPSIDLSSVRQALCLVDPWFTRESIDVIHSSHTTRIAVRFFYGLSTTHSGLDYKISTIFSSSSSSSSGPNSTNLPPTSGGGISSSSSPSSFRIRSWTSLSHASLTSSFSTCM